MSGNINRKPSTFDWVSERSNCSIKQMFEQMKMGIKQDVEMFNNGLKEKSHLFFEVAENAREIRVFPADQFSLDPIVVFSLNGNAIKVTRISDGENKQPVFDITIGLNDEGECMFSVGGKERESWQVRRMALEGLFFKA
jgi:hypothetical protein